MNEREIGEIVLMLGSAWIGFWMGRAFEQLIRTKKP